MRSGRTVRLLILLILRISGLSIRRRWVTIGRCLRMTRMWGILGRVDHSTTSFGPSQWILKGLRVYLASTLRVRDFVKKVKHDTYAGTARIGSGQSIAK